MFDYGIQNMKYYKKVDFVEIRRFEGFSNFFCGLKFKILPPSYDVRKVDVPVALFSSATDWLATPTDLSYLQKNLRNIVHDQTIEDMNHLEFSMGTNAAKLVYPSLIGLMKSHG
jgi:hypothetical protein